MDNVYVALLFMGGVVLFVAGVLCLGLGCYWFATAVKQAHTARAHGAQADATTTVIEESTRALDELPRTQLLPEYSGPPDAAELRELILANRRRRIPNDDKEYTTEGNEGIPEAPPIMPGTMYRGLGEL